MCRIFRNHPLKSIFLTITLLSCVHLIYKFKLTNNRNRKNDGSDIIRSLINNSKNLHGDSKKNSLGIDLDTCKANMSVLRSNIPILQNSYPIIELEKKPWAANVVRGCWSPANCTTPHKVAIIIPYRDRLEHLKIFLNHMHEFLQKQRISYGIFVIEQAPGTRFNRAALFNVGFKESLHDPSSQFNCFVFHDVDLLPSNENNFYTCDSSPLHMSVAIDKFNYKLPYADIFGGAVALSKDHFVLVNGFSNIFFGWGGEDDDMSSRLKFKNLVIHRYPNSVSRYVMVKHNIDKGNPVNSMRFELLKKSNERVDKDGLSSLIYDVVSRGTNNDTDLFRHITVQFPEKEILKQWNL